MPCNGEKDNYYSFVECIEQLQELIHTYQETHEIIIGGDFNENALTKTKTKRSICLHQFISDNELTTRSTGFTFTHPNGRDTSIIDFFLYKQKLDQRIIQIIRQENLAENVSDYYPVYMRINLKHDLIEKNPNSPKNQTYKINWNKIDKEQYTSIAARRLLNSDTELNMPENLDKAVHELNCILTESAKECIPEKKKRRKKPKLKVMTPAIQSVIFEKKRAFYIWKQNGRPNDADNFFLLEKKLKTAELRRQIRIEVAIRRQHEKNEIISARQFDNKLFHRLIRKQRGQCHKLLKNCMWVKTNILAKVSLMDGMSILETWL